MRHDVKSKYSRPHTKTYKVSKELAVFICKNSHLIKPFSFYVAVKHCFESSSISNWRSRYDFLSKVTGIKSKNTIRKRILECYKYGFFHGEFSSKHLSCKKTELIMKDRGIPVFLQSITSIHKPKLKNTKQIETYIKICAFQRHKERQVFAEKVSLIKNKMKIRSSDKEKLTKGLSKLVIRNAKCVEDQYVIGSIRAGRRCLGRNIQRSASTATRVVKKAKELNIVDEKVNKPLRLGDILSKHTIFEEMKEYHKVFKNFVYFKANSIYLKEANQVGLKLSVEYTPEKPVINDDKKLHDVYQYF